MASKQSTARKAETPPLMSPVRQALMRVAQNFQVSLAPFPDEHAVLAFKEDVDVALKAGITDADTHRNALQFLRDGKRLQRAIEDHWSKVTRWLEDRKKDIRTIQAMDLQGVAPGITGLNAAVLLYEDLERERVRKEQEKLRREEEERARQKRDAELAEMERQAQQAETASDDLSGRERVFVQRVYAALGVDRASERWLNATAQGCGFRQENYGVTLMGRDKIRYAIDAMTQAAALREQASAAAEKPLELREPEVHSNLGRVSGVRTHTSWTAECVDFDLFIDKFVAGEVDRQTFRTLVMPNAVAGNEMARAIHENIDRIPGWRHVKKVTKAG